MLPLTVQVGYFVHDVHYSLLITYHLMLVLSLGNKDDVIENMFLIILDPENFQKSIIQISLPEIFNFKKNTDDLLPVFVRFTFQSLQARCNRPVYPSPWTE